MIVELIRWYDYILYVLFFVLFYNVSMSFAKRKFGKDILQYFKWGLILKLVASIVYVHIYVYYYRYGDTIRYFRFGQFYKDMLGEVNNLGVWEWLTMQNDFFKSLISYKIEYAYGYADSSFIVNKISGVLSFFTFDSFIVNSMIFSYVSYIGLWYMYTAFIKLYPELKRELALSILFIPSVVFWGSGLMKDTICIGAISFMTYNLSYIFFLKEKKSIIGILINLFLFAFSAFMISKVKIYQLMAYLPGVFLWLFFFYRDKIKSNFIRVTITPLLLAFVAVVIVLGLQSFSDELDQYALDNVLDTAIMLSNSLANMDAGSTYDLGTIDPSLFGMLKKLPAAVNVTLFRPYIFEANNIVMLIAAIESSLILFLTIYVFYKVGFVKAIGRIFGSGVLLFCFLFTIIFGFATGMSSSNFGSLVRYKIPLMPFFISGIFILYFHATNSPLLERFFDKRDNQTKRKKEKRKEI